MPMDCCHERLVSLDGFGGDGDALDLLTGREAWGVLFVSLDSEC